MKPAIDCISVDSRKPDMGSMSDKTTGVACGICSVTFKDDMDLYLHEWFDHGISHSSSEDEEAERQGGLDAPMSSSKRNHPNIDRQSSTDEGINIFHIHKLFC